MHAITIDHSLITAVRYDVVIKVDASLWIEFAENVDSDDYH